MAKEKIKLVDESGDKKYFTIVPNFILNHSTGIDQALYLQMKRYAGENGRCFATERTLCKQLGVGIFSYRKSRNYLIEHGWIEYVGLSGGKTRPIKTYKVNDIWKQNTEHYEKIVPKTAISLGEDSSQISTKIVPRLAIEEEHIFKKNHTEAIGVVNDATSREIQDIISLFKEVNPSYAKFFANKTQRSSISRLLVQWPRPKLDNIIKVLPQTNSNKYAPTITTPLELEDRMGKLIAFIQKERNNQKSKIIIGL